MSNGDGTVGCILALAAAAYGGWWAWNRYEIRRRDEGPPQVMISPPPPSAAVPPVIRRPTGRIETENAKDGTKWFLDADSVKGRREERLAWVTVMPPPKRGDATYEQKSLYKINCTTSGYDPLTLIEYSKSGKVLRNFNDKELGGVQYSPPDTRIGAVIDRVCAPDFD